MTKIERREYYFNLPPTEFREIFQKAFPNARLFDRNIALDKMVELEFPDAPCHKCKKASQFVDWIDAQPEVAKSLSSNANRNVYYRSIMVDCPAHSIVETEIRPYCEHGHPIMLKEKLRTDSRVMSIYGCECGWRLFTVDGRMVTD